MQYTKDEIQAAIGKRIRQAREWQQMSQADLGEQVGRNQRSISQIENAERLLSSADLPLFAEALDVSLLFFYEDVLPERAPNAEVDQMLMAEFERLPTTASRQAAVNILRSLRSAVVGQDVEN